MAPQPFPSLGSFSPILEYLREVGEGVRGWGMLFQTQTAAFGLRRWLPHGCGDSPGARRVGRAGTHI